MNIGLFGIDFPHAKGDFCIRRAYPHYTVCSFDTDFLYEKDGVLVEGSKGDLLIMDPQEITFHGPRKDAKEGFVNDWVQISGEDFTELLARYPLPRNIAFPIGKSYPLRPYLEQLQSEFRCPADGREEFIRSILTQMVISLYRAYRHHHAQPVTRSVHVVADAVLQDPGHNWHLSDLAELSGYSVSRFSELFRAQYSFSPMQYVLQQRIHLAKQYLLSGQASISYIAEVCGFQSANYFCNYFKQVVGCPPSQYLAYHDAEESSPIAPQKGRIFMGKLILFDLDGTVTDSGEGIMNCAELALRHFGLPVPDRTTMRVFVGPPLHDTFLKCGVPADKVEEAVAVFRSRYTTIGKFENLPYPGIRQLLDRLNAQGHRLCIATSKPENMAVEILTKFGLADCFQTICGASLDTSRIKKEDVIAYLLAQHDCTGNAVMVGDTEFDVTGAAFHGIPTIGVSWGYGTVEAMEHAGAIAIAHNMDELYDLLNV